MQKYNLKDFEYQSTNKHSQVLTLTIPPDQYKGNRSKTITKVTVQIKKKKIQKTKKKKKKLQSMIKANKQIIKEQKSKVIDNTFEYIFNCLSENGSVTLTSLRKTLTSLKLYNVEEQTMINMINVLNKNYQQPDESQEDMINFINNKTSLTKKELEEIFKATKIPFTNIQKYFLGQN